MLQEVTPELGNSLVLITEPPEGGDASALYRTAKLGGTQLRLPRGALQLCRRVLNAVPMRNRGLSTCLVVAGRSARG
jgi:hypothetical protein